MIAPQLNGPFDIIGDVHGCYPELVELLQKIGYEITEKENGEVEVNNPHKRKLIFVGDLTDRGPNSVAVLKLVIHVVQHHKGYCVIGNHDDKLMRKLMGRKVQINNGLDTTLEELKAEPPQFAIKVRHFFESLPYYIWCDDKKLLIAHAGLPEKYHGVESKKVRDLSMYGLTTGKLDEQGMPQRLDWAKDYYGEPLVIFGHTPVREPLIKNSTINIDTGCVFGGKLTVLHYPEMEMVSVPARKQYAQPRRPF
jgi:protein phosphatase